MDASFSSFPGVVDCTALPHPNKRVAAKAKQARFIIKHKLPNLKSQISNRFYLQPSFKKLMAQTVLLLLY